MGIQRNLSLLWRRGADYIDKILRGAKPADIYFCDPRSPWQRGDNENTNGLLRQ